MLRRAWHKQGNAVLRFALSIESHPRPPSGRLVHATAHRSLYDYEPRQHTRTPTIPVRSTATLLCVQAVFDRYDVLGTPEREQRRLSALSTWLCPETRRAFPIPAFVGVRHYTQYINKHKGIIILGGRDFHSIPCLDRALTCSASPAYRSWPVTAPPAPKMRIPLPHPSSKPTHGGENLDGVDSVAAARTRSACCT